MIQKIDMGTDVKIFCKELLKSNIPVQVKMDIEDFLAGKLHDRRPVRTTPSKPAAVAQLPSSSPGQLSVHPVDHFKVPESIRKEPVVEVIINLLI